MFPNTLSNFKLKQGTTKISYHHIVNLNTFAENDSRSAPFVGPALLKYSLRRHKVQLRNSPLLPETYHLGRQATTTQRHQSTLVGQQALRWEHP